MPQDNRHPSLTGVLRSSVEFDYLVCPNAVLPDRSKPNTGASTPFGIARTATWWKAHVQSVEQPRILRWTEVSVDSRNHLASEVVEVLLMRGDHQDGDAEWGYQRTERRMRLEEPEASFIESSIERLPLA
jgi:hypothetical protein